MRRTPALALALAFALAAASGCARQETAALSGAVSTRVVASDRESATLLVGEPGSSGIARSAPGGVSVVSNGRTHTITTEPAALVAWSPRGDALAFGLASRDRSGAGGAAVSHIEVWDLGKSPSRLLANDGTAFAWALDGSALAIAADGVVWKVDVDHATGARTRVGLASGGAPVFYAPRLAFAPSGAALAVADERGLRVLALAGSGSLSLVPESDAGNASIVPFWSPEGRHLGAVIYPLAGGPSHASAGRVRVWEIDAPENPKDLGEIDNPWDFEPMFSPDGTSIALVSVRAGRRILILRKHSGPDVPLADLGTADRSTRARWISPTVVRVEGGPRIVDVTLR